MKMKNIIDTKVSYISTDCIAVKAILMNRCEILWKTQTHTHKNHLNVYVEKIKASCHMCRISHTRTHTHTLGLL